MIENNLENLIFQKKIFGVWGNKRERGVGSKGGWIFINKKMKIAYSSTEN